MKKIFLVFSIILASCSSTSFQPYYGHEEVKGEGGFITDEKDGVLFLSHGLPKGYNCVTLGIIYDSRHTGILIQAAKNSVIANKALEVGANTLLLADSQKEFVGTGNIMNAYSNTENITGETTYIAYDCQPDE